MYPHHGPHGIHNTHSYARSWYHMDTVVLSYAYHACNNGVSFKVQHLILINTYRKNQICLHTRIVVRLWYLGKISSVIYYYPESEGIKVFTPERCIYIYVCVYVCMYVYTSQVRLETMRQILIRVILCLQLSDAPWSSIYNTSCMHEIFFIWE